MMSRHDLHAEREWIAMVSERNERARRIKRMRNKVPRNEDERTLLLMVVILAVLPLAVGGVLWAML